MYTDLHTTFYLLQNLHGNGVLENNTMFFWESYCCCCIPFFVCCLFVSFFVCFFISLQAEINQDKKSINIGGPEIPFTLKCAV